MSREREERREKRLKALSRFGPRRWLAILAAVARWHLAAPDWAPSAPYGLSGPDPQQQPWEGVPELPALEVLTLARLAAVRDGRRSLARVLLDVHLIAAASREDEVVHLLELMATGTRAQLPSREVVH